LLQVVVAVVERKITMSAAAVVEPEVYLPLRLLVFQLVRLTQ
jgi:hypothetical protein